MSEVPQRRPVVVGVDGSTSARRAVRWAAREAVRRDAPLLIAHSCALVPAVVPHAVALHAYREAVVNDGRAWLAEAVAAAEDAAAGVVVRTELGGGWAAEQLIGLSASAELVVLGSRGLGGFTGLVVGSIAVAVATHGHCPVVVVRGAGEQDEPREDGPVVVGVDGSPTSEAAMRFAFRAAAARGVPLLAVHVWADFAVGSAWESALSGEWESIRTEQMQLLNRQLAACGEEVPGVRVDQVVSRDRPAHALLEHSKRAQLVVVGSRGRGGFRGLLLGSTSQALVYHSACPVAVVPSVRR